MKKIILTSILFSSLFIGCATKPITPIQVTKSFWKAEKNKNFKEAKELSFMAEENDVKLHKTIKIEDFKIGNPRIQGDKAEVETTLFLDNPIDKKLNNKNMKVDFNTTLLQNNKEWKIDIDTTKRVLYSESAKQFSADIFSTLKEKLGNFQILKSAFEKVIKEIEEDIEKERQ